MEKTVRLKYAVDAQGKASIAPTAENPVLATRGMTIRFVPDNAGVTNADLKVIFKGKSPFRLENGDETFEGGRDLDVVRDEVPGGAGSNRYPFDCKLKINGEEVTVSGGGEIEVRKPGGGGGE